VYSSVTADIPPPELLPFYQCYRASMWARLAQWRISEHSDEAKWRERSHAYLKLAEQYSQRI